MNISMGAGKRLGPISARVREGGEGTHLILKEENSSESVLVTFLSIKADRVQPIADLINGLYAEPEAAE